MNKPFSLDIKNMFPKNLKGLEGAKADYNLFLSKLDRLRNQIRSEFSEGTVPHWNLPFQEDDLSEISALAEYLITNFNKVLILATGGSSLGARALMEIIENNNEIDGKLKIVFCDNLDPKDMEALVNKLNFSETAFIAISKSGSTDEVIAQLLLCFDKFQSSSNEVQPKDHFFSIVEPGDSPLRKFSRLHNLIVLDHLQNLGGRYSVLSSVGMLPAMLKGLDIINIRNGAQEVMKNLLESEKIEEVPSAVSAASIIALLKNSGIQLNVMMPYTTKLEQFTLWHRQLLAESIGKNGVGITPIPALGPVDQHSQLQLYLDGPKDKLFTIIYVDKQSKGALIPSEIAKSIGADHLSDSSLGEIVTAQHKAIIKVLSDEGCPTRVITLPFINERIMGSLFQNFIIETIFSAELLNINPYDQPAVEGAKKIVRNSLYTGRN